MARLDFNEDDVIDFKDEELMELGKNRCREIQSKPGGGCLVCDDDDDGTPEIDPCVTNAN